MSENKIGNTAVLIQNSSDLLAELRDNTRMTCALAVFAEEANRGVVLASLPGTGDHAYVPRIGFHFHLHSTAPGKALLAFTPEAKRRELISKLNFRKFTDKTILNGEQLESALAGYARQKYSVDIGEYAEGVNCVASCICDEKDEPLAAIWITALSVELPVSALPAMAKRVVSTADEIGKRLRQNNPDSSPYVNETLKQAKQFIEDHFNEESKIHDFIAGLHMSESWFRTRFRETYGVSPMQYRHTLVYNKAKQLLEHTQLPIKEIAFQLGFDSQNYFSRAFKNQEGLSPAQYREHKKS